jgi:hypothetical protein
MPMEWGPIRHLVLAVIIFNSLLTCPSEGCYVGRTSIIKKS